MDLQDRVIVVTGGASGIGAGLVRRFAAESPAGLVVADRDADGAAAVADEVGAMAVTVDVADGGSVTELFDAVRAEFGRVDVVASNAGIAVGGGPDEASDADWQRIWDVNVMAHVHVTRAVLPEMLERGEGYLLGTVSAAGLLNHVFAAPYAVTKSAALSLYEWLAIAHGPAGVRVSALCPQGVRTPMLAEDRMPFLHANAIEPEDVAEVVVEGMREERFLILPHPEVADYAARRGKDHGRWIEGMQRLRTQMIAMADEDE